MRTAGPVRAALQALDPSLPVSPPRTLDEVVGASLTQRRFNMTLLTVFAGIALILAVAGIYGTVAYSVAQRTQEIGIRVALGATSREILAMVLTGALKPVVAGLAMGIAAALALRGRRTLLVDLDPQANSTMSYLDMPQVTRSVYDAIAEPAVSLADVILPSALDLHAIFGWSPSLLGIMLIAAALPLLVAAAMLRRRYRRGRLLMPRGE